jgi:hypothetical protein
LKSNSDDLLIKEKAITDIPLDTTDDEAIKLLFGKIDEDVKFVLNWAKYKASELFERYSENIDVIDYRDFEIGSRLIEKKYNISRSSGDSLTSFAHKVGIPTSYSLDAFKYLLIDQHPEITQSFLSNLKMFNSKWHKIGVVQSDNSFYLIGEKNRKGKKTGQQKVKLTEKSLLLVEQIIQITKPLRLYLEFKNNSDFQYLFLSTNRAFHGVGRAKDRDPKDVRKKPSHRQFVEDFSSLNDISLQDATALCSKLSLTRFRGSKGIQVYIETTSVKSMSKALGHEKYKQSLLSHYLPEPIIRFFKERWVRIFQKGIVCESMKSSSHLLKASSFKSIKELDNFLRLHALKIIPAKESRQSKLNGEKIYETAIIYLNPEVLTILLSFELAVENIKKPSPYICYWAKFSHALKKEINERIRDPEFLDMLSIAENKAHISLLGDLINE